MAKLPMPFNNPRTYTNHSGVDFPQPRGTRIPALGNGVVLRTPYTAKGGYWTTVQYDNGLLGSAHQDSPVTVVKPGQRVTAGQTIGYVGSLGANSTGSHLHLENVNNPTYEGVMALLDKSRVVGVPAPAGTSGGTDMNRTSRPIKDIQTLVGTTADGIWGPNTTAAVKTWQTNNRLVADGIWGAVSDAVGFAIKVDGQWGLATTAKFQAALGVPVDGVQGPQTTSAFQSAVGIKVDGEWGPVTAKALQAQLGVTQDGEIGPATTTALQTFLNAGKKFTKPVTTTPTPTPTTVPGKNATSRPLTQIQAFLKVPNTGVWDQATSDAVAAFQTTQGILVDHVWGNASDGLAFPPAGSLHGIDYSFSRPSPALLASRGVKHVGRYLHDSSKGLTRSEYDGLRAAGINVWLIFERDGKELLGGFSAGVECANIAEGQRNSLGLPAQPIYFNVDYDAPDSDMPKILDALAGVASVIGAGRVGLYGSYRVIKAAFDAGKIAWGFQTYAWSAGQWEARAQLQQWANGQWGGTVDFTRAMTAEYGQHAVSTAEEPEPSEDMISVPRAELERIQTVLNGWLA